MVNLLQPYRFQGFVSIAEENARTGYAESNWQVTDEGNGAVFGFASAMSVSPGQTINFKVHSGTTTYTIEIVRLGWYGGNGGRLVDTLAVHTGGATQSNGTLRTNGEGATGSRDCSAWTVTDSWTVPQFATHGVYVAVIKPSSGARSHIGPFVVSNPVGAVSKVVCLLSDMTWQAYNGFGTIASPVSGKTLYGVGTGIDQATRAWDVSYDRPMMTNASASQQTFYWNGERPVHSFLERNGYDISYVTCLDVDADASLLLGHQTLLISGHHEYWSQNLRDAWDAAVTAGAQVISLSGNTLLWRTRMTGRLMSCYKDSHSLDGLGTGEDPVTWTGTWRDTRWPERRCENVSVGTMFVANGIRSDTPTVGVAFNAEPLWRDTAIAALGSGSVSLKSESLGFEWDSYEPFYSNSLTYPAEMKFLSDTSVNLSGNSSNEDGSQYNVTINPAHHRILAWKRNGKLNLNFGTNQYGWGLSDFHTRGTTGVNTNMQQSIINAFADMGIMPVTLMSGMVSPTNNFASWSWPTITSFSIPSTLDLTTTQTDKLATTVVWSNSVTSDIAYDCSWSSSSPGVATVVKGKVTAVSAGTTTITATYGASSDTCLVTVAAPGADDYDTWLALNYAYIGTTETDGPYTLGTLFRRTVGETSNITVYGVRFWRTTVANGSNPPIAYLGGGGSVLAEVTGSATTPGTAGWQELIFPTPYVINNSTTEYAVWVSPLVGYPTLSGYFASANVASRGNLYTSGASAGAGKFRAGPPYPDEDPPASAFANTFYLVEPLVLEGDPPATAPGVPTLSSAIAGNAQVALTWSAPAGDGGSAITDYVVQYRTTTGPGSWNTFSDGTSTGVTATVTGLTNGTGYDFQIAAVNAIGQGGYSSTMSATPTAGASFETIVYRSQTTTTYATRTNTVVNKPSGVVDGDLLLFRIVTGLQTEAPDATPPAGLTQIGTTIDMVDGSGYNVEARTYYRVASSEPSSYTFTHTSCSSQGIILAYDGVDTTTPLDVTPSVATSTGNTSTATSITTVTANAMLVLIESDWADAAAASTPPTGMTERFDATLSYVAEQVKTTAGATGTKVLTNSNVNGGSRWSAVLIALRPAAI